METGQSPLILVLIFMLIHVLMLTVGICMYVYLHDYNYTNSVFARVVFHRILKGQLLLQL